VSIFVWFKEGGAIPPLVRTTEKNEYVRTQKIILHTSAVSTLALSYLNVSRVALQRQIRLWQRYLPAVVPHYAVKCNNDPMLMKWMTELHPDMHFDCASVREIDDVLPLVKPNRIIYAQPCKKYEDIRIASEKGIESTVADSVEEIEKLSDWKGSVLIRLLVSDKDSKQPFGKKFGAPLEWIPEMCRVAKHLGQNLTGFSFHVGSECQRPEQYRDALEMCKEGQHILETHGFTTHTVDIGGGFLPDEESFRSVAEHVRTAQAKLFPTIRMIAEPGRFLAAPTHTLFTTVIGRKPVYPPPRTADDPKWRITIDESVYGTFSNIPFDHQKPKFECLKPQSDAVTKRPTIVFGRTCDSGDCIGDDVLLPEVNVGDVFRIPNMGAYTTVTASEFNGFPKSKKIYE
jgi:ornithine decarboxylase